ncbi:MAG: hypothetical protein Q8P22_14150 [Chloroflexota bacterium]|nr:hypothetical protein [Chloroflexota bacterium]
MNEQDIIAALRRHHRPPQWVFFDELRVGTGFSGRYADREVEQRVDAWAISCWDSGRYRRIAYEVKVSRADFKRELADPSKRQATLRISNEMYLVCPARLIQKGEAPEELGLVWVTERHATHLVKRAPYRDTPFPGWPFVASLARRAWLASNGGGKNILEAARGKQAP